MAEINPRLRAVLDLNVAEAREYAGRHEYDGKIQDLSPAGVRDSLQRLAALKGLIAEQNGAIEHRGPRAPKIEKIDAQAMARPEPEHQFKAGLIGLVGEPQVLLSRQRRSDDAVAPIAVELAEGADAAPQEHRLQRQVVGNGARIRRRFGRR